MRLEPRISITRVSFIKGDNLRENSKNSSLIVHIRYTLSEIPKARRPTIRPQYCNGKTVERCQMHNTAKIWLY